METRPQCRLCGQRDHWIPEHLKKAHGLGLEAYLTRFPGAPTASVGVSEVLDRIETGWKVVRKRPSADLRVDFGGVRAPVATDGPASACLPLPSHFKIPTHGRLGSDVSAVAVALACGRSVYIHGPSGSGKDALIHAWSALTRRPGLVFQMDPSADVRSWFYSHEFDASGTRWEEGLLLRALRDGYVAPSGRRVPYLVLVTDFDRATREQAESLRLVLDSIEGRVPGPDGTVHSVLDGTLFAFTANTAGGGDHRGRYTSANVIDASILDRIDRAYEFHPMDWFDEVHVVVAKFPTLNAECSGVIEGMRGVTRALRDATRKEELFGDFSHRSLCSVLGAAEDILRLKGTTDAGELLRAGLRSFVDRLPDPESRQTAWRLADPFVPGGAILPEVRR